jgi:hypothetical protein
MKVRWSMLSRLGSSKLVLTSYLWFALVPVAAKAVSALEEFAAKSQWPLLVPDLPFKWQAFFFAALFFSLANLVYLLSCPDIIRNYRSAVAFKDEGKTATQLVELFVDVVKRKSLGKSGSVGAARALAMTMNPEDRLPNELDLARPEISATELRNALLAVDASKANLDESFWQVYDLADNAHPIARYSAGTLYVIGLFFIAIVVAQNIASVFRTVHGEGWLLEILG